MNYTELTNTIKSYCENDFPDTIGSGSLTSKQQVDTFIQQAEKRIYNTVRLPIFRKNQTGQVTVGNRYLSLPSDWLDTHELFIMDGSGRYHALRQRDVSYLRETYPDATQGLPKAFSLYADKTHTVAPIPDANYNVEIHYFYYPQSIVSATTTWLGDNFDQCLLYGALLEACTFQKEEGDTYEKYKVRYDEAMAGLIRLSKEDDLDDYSVQETERN